MTPEEWQRVRPILESALELDSANRATFLDEACADPLLRGEVESLIAVHEQAGTGLLSSAAAPAFFSGQEARFRLLPGKRIGAYEIVEEIAVGGMGAVYRAVRADGQYRQNVALKIVRSELGAEFTATRFKNERQILATLNHPNIARILDGGTTTEGMPYFVMELIEGQRVDEYCDRQKLATNERLDLFLQVCSAVQYAHQRLVIHRDIKPGNILVNAEGVPKLLDFGIAKILESNEANDHPQQTLTLVHLLTPEYASPEQVKGEPITTASNVYSLGVVLYELLTGHTPYNVSTHTPHEFARAICETEPEKPSTAVRRNKIAASDDGEKAAKNSTLSVLARESSPEKLCKRLRGDLDNILLMALRKEPHRRYSSVEQFAQDIRRHLDHLPVLARKDTAAYRASKFITRHKVGAGATALVTVALLAALGVTLREARIARAERARAEQRFNDVRKLANSLLFDIHDAIRDLPGSTPARRILIERALQYLDSLAAEAGNDASLMRELATAYERVGEVQGHYLNDNLGDTAAGVRSYQKALQVRQKLAIRSIDWHDQLALAHSYRIVASQLLATGDTHSAFDSIRKAVALGESIRASHSEDMAVLEELSSDYEIAGHIQGGDSAVGLNDEPGALENYRKALEVDDAMLAIDPSNESAQHGLAMDSMFLGDSLLILGDQSAALQNYQRTLEIAQRIAQHSTAIRRQREVAVAYNRIAGIYTDKGDWNGVRENNQKALEIYERLIAKDPQNALLSQGLAIAWVNVGNAMGKGGNREAGLAAIGKGLAMMEAIVGANPQNAQQRGVLAAMHVSRAENFAGWSKRPEALKEYEAALSIYEALYRLDGSNQAARLNAAASKAAIGTLMRQMRNTKLALENFRQALVIVEPLLVEKVLDQQALYTAADTYAGLGDIESREAETPTLGLARSREHWERARSWYARSLETWKKIQHPTRVSPNGFDTGGPKDVETNLRRCDAALQQISTGAR
ncbi:MAG: hypothetical protein DMG38_23270 [Acidobacteria bacterium]|nr:MAG: hypothetical protein DMG38_23270 [Acidobacteriota bacterium]